MLHKVDVPSSFMRRLYLSGMLLVAAPRTYTGHLLAMSY
jgi:hypothetical protein